MNIRQFKPMLLPNEITGVAPDWDARIKNPSEWLYSKKLDGGRVELYGDGTVKGRSLKEIPNVFIQGMAKDISLMLNLREDCIIEAEFYSEEMNFAEIMHFFRTEDVTSTETVKKYENLWKKSKGDPEKGWPFPGRDVAWATTWHDSLKFHAFSYIDLSDEYAPFAKRQNVLSGIIENYNSRLMGLEDYLVLIPQNEFSDVEELYQAFDQSIISGGEGIVITKKSAEYKTGRYTLNSNTVYKLKDDSYEWDGQILGVEEGTVAREGAEKTINELGRSKTSQLQEDRIPSGMAKGFKVRLDDGQELIVSLNGYNHEDRILLLTEEANYIGKWIRFKGMQPVKKGGLPRHAIYSRGNIRDDK